MTRHRPLFSSLSLLNFFFFFSLLMHNCYFHTCHIFPLSLSFSLFRSLLPRTSRRRRRRKIVRKLSFDFTKLFLSLSLENFLTTNRTRGEREKVNFGVIGRERLSEEPEKEISSFFLLHRWTVTFVFFRFDPSFLLSCFPFPSFLPF